MVSWFSHGFPSESPGNFQEFYPHGFAGELDLVPEGLPGLPALPKQRAGCTTTLKGGEKWENFGWVKSII